MKRTLMALAAVATLAVSALAVPAPAHAQRGVGVGIAAGLLGGAIIGGAIASSPYYYGPGYYPGYRPYGYYGGPPPLPHRPFRRCRPPRPALLGADRCGGRPRQERPSIPPAAV